MGVFNQNIDWDKPFYTVHNMSRAKYQQGGVYFDVDGKAIDIHAEADLNPAVEESKETILRSNTESSDTHNEKEDESEVTVPAEKKSRYEFMGWQDLKKLVEEFGETYVNKGEAIAFLKEKDAEAEAAAQAREEEDATAEVLNPPDLPETPTSEG